MSLNPRVLVPAAVSIAGVTAAVLAGAAGPAAATGHAAPRTSSAMGGQAYGSTARLGSLVKSDKTAYVPLCTTRRGVRRHDRTAAVSLPGVGRIGAVTTKMSTQRTPTGPRSVAKTHTATTSLLGGVIKADVIASRATATRTPSGTRLHGRSTFVGLTIAGQAVPNPTPNKTITLPGLGSLVLDQVTRDRRFGNARVAVAALHLTLGANNSAGLPAGQVIIGRSVASLHRPTHRQVAGSAWGTRVKVGQVVKSGRTAPVYLPCGGTSGKTVSRDATASVRLPGVLRGGQVASHANSTDTARRTRVDTRNHVAHVVLLGGAIRVRGINAHAVATRRASGRLIRSTVGTGVVRLNVNGKVLPIKTKANARYSLAGIGTLWLHRVVRGRDGVQVYALQLVLGQARNGLPAGAVITAGAARAIVRR